MATCEFSPMGKNQATDENQCPISCISQKDMVFHLYKLFEEFNLGFRMKDTALSLCGVNGFNDDRHYRCEAFIDLLEFGNASEHSAFYHGL
jgi:hypothetical protein